MTVSESMKEAFELAVSKAGGQSSLSRELDRRGISVSQQRLWHHLRIKGMCPAELVLAIEEIVGVSRHELRPDVFGHASVVAAVNSKDRRVGERRSGERRQADRRAKAA